MTKQSKQIQAVDLIRTITNALIDPESTFEITSSINMGITTIHLTLPPSQTGKLIGKAGRMARAIRTVLGAHGQGCEQRYMLNIVPPGHSEEVMENDV